MGGIGRSGASRPAVFLYCALLSSRVGQWDRLRSLWWGSLSLRWGVSKGLFDCSVEVLLRYSARTADSFEFSLCGLANVSMNPTGSGGAVGMASWVGAIAVGAHSFVGAAFAILSLMSVCSITALHTAGYSSAAGSIAVSLAAWVMSLYSRVFVDFFRELADAKELERADWLLV